MKREYWAGAVLGLFLLAYVLEAVANPLALDLSSPYAFAQNGLYTRYPFSTAIVVIRALAIFITPLLLTSLFKGAYFAKAVSLLILSGLIQLYAIQAIVTGILTVPLEWALSLTLAGILLLIPVLYYFFKGLTGSAKKGIAKAAVQTTGDTTTPDWLDD
jgi:hypothetical protein